MVLDPLAAQRVSQTAPLQAPPSARGPSPDRPLEVSEPAGFQADGGQAGVYGTKADLIGTLEFRDLPAPDLSDTVAISSADKALATQRDAIGDAETAWQFACKGPATVQTERKSDRLHAAGEGLQQAVTIVDQAMAGLSTAMDHLSDGSTKQAKAMDRLEQLRGLHKELTGAKSTLDGHVASFSKQVEATREAGDQRVTALHEVRKVATGADSSRTAMATKLEGLADTVKKFGGSHAAAGLFGEMVDSLRGKAGHSVDSVKAAWTAIEANPAVHRKAEIALLQQSVDGVLKALTGPTASPAKEGITAAHDAIPGMRTVPTARRFGADTDGVAGRAERNHEITRTYRTLETCMQQFLGEPHTDSWLAMGANASGEIGTVLDRTVLGDFFAAPVTSTWTLANGVGLQTSTHFYEALAEGNREIYNTIAPSMSIFLEAESKGLDGVEALKRSTHFQKNLMQSAAHPTYANTEPLLKAFKLFQDARKEPDLTKRADMVMKANVQVAIYEQKYVLQPVMDRPEVRKVLETASAALAWTDPNGKREALLPGGGNWADYGTRMAAITKVAQRFHDHSVAPRAHRSDGADPHAAPAPVTYRFHPMRT